MDTDKNNHTPLMNRSADNVGQASRLSSECVRTSGSSASLMGQARRPPYV
jgi:hypothetical protein